MDTGHDHHRAHVLKQIKHRTLKRTYHIFLTALCCLLAVLTNGCVTADEQLPGEQQQPAVLSVYIYPSGQPMVTRADEGLVNAYAREKAVHQLQIWLFRHSDGQQLLYMSPESNNLISGEAERYAYALSEENGWTDAEIEALKGLNVDVYVLANGGSIGSTLGESSTRAQVKAAIISSDHFGTTTLTTDIATEGLPMSGYLENTTITGNRPSFQVPVVRLLRCVSKVRFIFAQLEDNGMDCQITSLQLDASLIPTTENVFNFTANPYSISTTYIGSATPITPPATIATTDDITGLIFDGQEPQEYEDLIDEAVSSRKVTEVGPIYLRESDKRLTGTIQFSVDGGITTKTATFQMDATDQGAKNFSRNHTWIVYAYFLGGRLYVKPTILPWEAAHDRYAFNTQGSTDMAYEGYLRYDKDKHAFTWNDTYVAVAYGFEDNDESKKPLYSPLIELKTINNNEQLLQLNNEHFFFIKTNAEGSVYIHSGQMIEIAPSDEQQSTFFYVVPTTTAQSSDNIAKVFLTEIHVGDGMPPVNKPFNHNLPGDEDHTTILFYNPGTATWTQYQNQSVYKPQPGNEQSYQYWWQDLE